MHAERLWFTEMCRAEKRIMVYVKPQFNDIQLWVELIRKNQGKDLLQKVSAKRFFYIYVETLACTAWYKVLCSRVLCRRCDERLIPAFVECDEGGGIGGAELSRMPAEPTNTSSQGLPRRPLIVPDSKCTGPSLCDVEAECNSDWRIDYGDGMGLLLEVNSTCVWGEMRGGACINTWWAYVSRWRWRVCRKHTYLCSGHLVPGEFGIPQSVRKTRTSSWPRFRHISSKPFRWRVFCLLPLQKHEKRTSIQLTQTIIELWKWQLHPALNLALLFFVVLISPCPVATFSASHLTSQYKSVRLEALFTSVSSSLNRWLYYPSVISSRVFTYSTLFTWCLFKPSIFLY